MNDRPETSSSGRQWVEKAEHDLINAEYTLTLEKNCPLDTVCFHAQQCAEKYLKAFLVQKSISFPKTHDLRVLMKKGMRHFLVRFADNPTNAEAV